MSFQPKTERSPAVDDILARVGRLSVADRRLFMRTIRRQEIKDDLTWLHKVWGRVTLKDSEITRMVEDVRAEMHAARTSHKDRR